MSKRRSGSKTRSKRGSRQRRERVKPLVLVIAEGDTEREYVKALASKRYDGCIVFKFKGKPGHASLVNLVREARKHSCSSFPKTDQVSIWIICDYDDNTTHKNKLENWVRSGKCHRSAVSYPCIEYWFLLHYTNKKKPNNARDARRHLEEQVNGEYEKGELPTGLIEKTDDALRHARVHTDPIAEGKVWPTSRCSQLPRFIEFLDSLVASS